jgi:hypothetical protein
MTLPNSLAQAAEDAAEKYAEPVFEPKTLIDISREGAFLAGVQWLFTHLSEQAEEFDALELHREARDEAEGRTDIRDQGATYTFADGAVWGAREQEQRFAALITGLREELKNAYPELDKQILALQAKLTRMTEALAFYADKSKWHEFISGGNIGSAQDGDFMMAFDDGEDAPWSIARQALAETERG